VKLEQLTSVLDFQGGSQPPKKDFESQPSKSNIRFLQIRDFKTDDKIVYIPISKKNRLCKKEDILIARYGASVGQILSGKEGAYNVALMKVIDKNELYKSRYLYYFFNSPYFQKNLLSRSERSAQAGFNKGDLSEIKIPVPSLQDQEKIVEKLDKVFENIELKFNVYKNKIELNKQMCKSKLNQIFNDELYKSGGIKLNDFVDLQKGKKPEISQQRKRNLPYLTAKYIRGESEPEYGIPDSKGIVLVNPKDYVIIMDGSNSGEVFTGINGILASTMGKIVLKQKINIKYLGYFLDFNKENFANTKTGSAIPHLSKEVFFNLRIPDITLKEQEKIVDKLDKFFINIDTNLKIIDKEKFLLNNLKKSILNKEFSYE
jgi:type I restriction enzyme S subunit